MPRYKVIVGGTRAVYDGDNIFEAIADFNHYQRESMGIPAGFVDTPGKANGETVTLMVDEKIDKEFVPGRKTIRKATSNKE